MKNINRLLFLPLVAALAIGCSTPTSMQTSEYDDVYYSSKDKTIIKDKEVTAAIEDESQAEASDTESNSAPNPEYSENNSGTATTRNNDQDYYSENYYNDNDYYYSSRIRRFHAPYRGLSYYDFAYTDPFWYNRSLGYYGRSMYYDPFYAYDPFLSPYGYSPFYGGISIMLGRPFYGGLGYGGLGYGGFGYGGLYGGYNRGFYNGFYNGLYASNGWYRNDLNSTRRVQYGPRRDRSNVPVGSSVGTSGGGRPSRNSGGGSVGGGSTAGGGGIARPDDTNTRYGRPARGRNTAETGTIDPANTSQPVERAADTQIRPIRGRRQVDANPTQPDLERTAAPAEQTRASRRERISAPVTNMPDQGERRVQEAPVQRERVYRPQRQEQPRQREIYRAEPTYQAPRQERSYDYPSSRPSYSPSGGSYNGGGSSGGSSGGGRGGRPRN